MLKKGEFVRVCYNFYRHRFIKPFIITVVKLSSCPLSKKQTFFTKETTYTYIFRPPNAHTANEQYG